MTQLVPTWLKELSLIQCNMTDDAIPKELGSLPSLEILKISKSNVRNLPNLDGLSYLKHFLLDACDRLESIPDLPTKLEYIGVARCGQLKRVPDMSRMPDLFILALIDCVNLDGVPGLNKLLTKSLGDFSLSNSSMPTLHEAIIWEIIDKRCYNILNTHLVGDDIPRGFTFINKGSSVCFDVPELINWKLEGFACCILYSYVDRGHVSSKRPSLLLENHTKQHLVTISSSMNLYPYRNNQLWVRLVKDGFHYSEQEPQHLKLESGDKFVVEFSPGDSNMIVKKIGVLLLLENETNSYDRKNFTDFVVLTKNPIVLMRKIFTFLKNLTKVYEEFHISVEEFYSSVGEFYSSIQEVSKEEFYSFVEEVSKEEFYSSVEEVSEEFYSSIEEILSKSRKILSVIHTIPYSFVEEVSKEEFYSSVEEFYSSIKKILSKTRIILSIIHTISYSFVKEVSEEVSAKTRTILSKTRTIEEDIQFCQKVLELRQSRNAIMSKSLRALSHLYE